MGNARRARRAAAVIAAFVLPLRLLTLLPAGGCMTVAQVPLPLPNAAAEVPEPDSPSAAERRLHALLNEYRVANHLKPVALSRSLSKVARLHAADLSTHGFTDTCSLHSWSRDGAWTSCCYDQRHPDTRCMWNKPRELTPYDGVGYEIAYRYSAGVRPTAALQAWKTSERHSSVILNLGRWSRHKWKAVGIGIDGQYATVWWGEDPDPAGYWK